MTQTAWLSIQVFVSCPNCDKLIDLMDENDTDGYNHNEDGWVIGQACPDEGYWIDAHKDFSIKNVTCTECKETFGVKGLEW